MKRLDTPLTRVNGGGGFPYQPADEPAMPVEWPEAKEPIDIDHNPAPLPQ